MFARAEVLAAAAPRHGDAYMNEPEFKLSEQPDPTRVLTLPPFFEVGTLYVITGGPMDFRLERIGKLEDGKIPGQAPSSTDPFVVK